MSAHDQYYDEDRRRWPELDARGDEADADLYDDDDTPPHGIERPVPTFVPEGMGAYDAPCDDPNCLVCCDDETFARLTKFTTTKG